MGWALVYAKLFLYNLLTIFFSYMKEERELHTTLVSVGFPSFDRTFQEEEVY